jgi:putative transposase
MTVVTKDRKPLLITHENLELFWRTTKTVQTLHPFHLTAYVILPDHFHFLLRTEDKSGNFSKILHSLKRNFTQNYKQHHQIREPLKLWQARFWDHVIRDERDLDKHMDYIHWNPVKHGYVASPGEWEQSSFRFWYEKAYYPGGWGKGIPPDTITDMEFE